jgi:hypothetical protein
MRANQAMHRSLAEKLCSLAASGKIQKWNREGSRNRVFQSYKFPDGGLIYAEKRHNGKRFISTCYIRFDKFGRAFTMSEFALLRLKYGNLLNKITP